MWLQDSNVLTYLLNWWRFLESAFYELLMLPKLSANEIFSRLKLYFNCVVEYAYFKTASVRSFLSPVIAVLVIPISICYYLNVTLPLYIFESINRNILLVRDVLSRRSVYTRQFIMHISALNRIAHSMWRTAIDTKLSDIISWIYQALMDVSTI